LFVLRIIDCKHGMVDEEKSVSIIHPILYYFKL
jgi:hypothetical protein